MSYKIWTFFIWLQIEKNLMHLFGYIYIYIYIFGWVKVISSVTLSNVTPLNILLLNSYFENRTIGLHVLYVFNLHVNFCTNQMLFTIQSINSYFMQYFNLRKLEFKQFMDDITINL